MSIWRKTLSKAKKSKVFKRDGYMCVHCFTPWNLTIDHIVPVSKGGHNGLSNLQTLCEDCNKEKGVRDGSKVVEDTSIAMHQHRQLREQRGY